MTSYVNDRSITRQAKKVCHSNESSLDLSSKIHAILRTINQTHSSGSFDECRSYISFFIKLLFSFIGVVVSRPDTSGWPGVFDGGEGGGGFGSISSTKEPPDGEVWSPTRFIFSQQTLVSSGIKQGNT